MDWAAAFGGVSTSINALVEDLVPLIIPVFVTLAGIGIGFSLFRKVGVRR